MSIEFLTDDWKKIPQNTRYFFLFGIFLIFMSWLIDNWGGGELKVFFGYDIRKASFNLGLVVMFFGFLFLILKQFLIFGRTLFYRKKYPLKNLGIEFTIRWYGGRLYIFDLKEKKYYHVLPWETAQNLLLIGPKVFQSKNSLETEKESEFEIGSEKFRIKDFNNGGFINTT